MKNINLHNVTIDHKKLREMRGETAQADVGEQIGVSDRQISNIEQGIRKPSADGLLRLMLLYGLTAQDLAVEK